MAIISRKALVINSSYDACAIVEAFTDSYPTKEELLEAWAYLIKTGDCWRLQGFYGRGAASLITQNIISEEGEINWENVADSE
jgi:hypothetical protein